MLVLLNNSKKSFANIHLRFQGNLLSFEGWMDCISESNKTYAAQMAEAIKKTVYLSVEYLSRIINIREKENLCGFAIENEYRKCV